MTRSFPRSCVRRIASAPVTLVSALLLLSALAPQARGGDVPVAERIRRVENGLLAPIRLKGGPLETMRLADRLARFKIPGVSVAVINGGKVEWAKGYGVREAGTNAPVTPETLFQAASISKPVAALAALHFIERGILSMDGDVNDKLISWKVSANAFTAQKAVTVREILSHSAGLTVHGFPGYAPGSEIPSLVAVLDGAKPANTESVRVEALPGSVWSYSGGGYTVLQQLFIDVLHESFPRLMSETVLGPAGMRHSTYEQPLPKDRLPFAAVAHLANGDGGRRALDDAVGPLPVRHRGHERLERAVRPGRRARHGQRDADGSEGPERTGAHALRERDKAPVRARRLERGIHLHARSLSRDREGRCRHGQLRRRSEALR
jgi:CubicO group peptidase (beta-lactamase class C family)